jgi:hypothetical protein
LRVALTCEPCDDTFRKTHLAFAQLVADATSSDVDVVAASTPAGADVQWTLTFTGHGTFTGQNRTVRFPIAQSATPDQIRADLARFLKLGLAEYAVSTPAGRYMDVAFTRPGAAAAADTRQDQRDPWNYWVFRLSAETFGFGEESQADGNYFMSGSANRVTEQWKIRVSYGRSLSKSRFEIDDETTIRSRRSDWSLTSLVVKSLGPKWSFGLTGTASGSSYNNTELLLRISPGLEYDFFPYKESSKRSLTLQYSIGGAHYDYEAETIYGKVEEMIASHSVIASLGLAQPWGDAGGTFVFAQQMTAPERTRLSMDGNFSIRLFKALRVNTFASYSRIRDQFTLEKGEATDEEVLLRQRQLATGFRYSFGFGISYSFGALGNVTVNPRFGG